MTLEACKRACVQNKLCNAIQYGNVDECWLKDGDATTAKSHDGFDVYVFLGDRNKKGTLTLTILLRDLVSVGICNAFK